MTNPDKPHVFRGRLITDTREWGTYTPHTPHGRDEPCPEGIHSGKWPRGKAEPDDVCDVCGGSYQLLIHNLEFHRFRKRYASKSMGFF